MDKMSDRHRGEVTSNDRPQGSLPPLVNLSRNVRFWAKFVCASATEMKAQSGLRSIR